MLVTGSVVVDKKRLIDVAMGRKKADLVLKNCRIVNVFTHEVTAGSLAIDQGVIAGTGAYEGREEREMEGHYLLPGLIDSHVHIESSLVSPEQFARIVVPRGTTTVIADPPRDCQCGRHRGYPVHDKCLKRPPSGFLLYAPLLCSGHML